LARRHGGEEQIGRQSRLEAMEVGGDVTGAKAGMIAAAVWAAAEPTIRRLARTPYSDVRLLGRGLISGPAWPAVGLGIHLLNGAIFGAAFERAGGRGVRAGVIAAELENALLWPAFALVDRFHRDRRNGTWPRLVTNRRVAVQEVLAHALFGAVLGALTRADSR
jgi:hypothetical protein